VRIRTVGRERISSWLPALQQDMDRMRLHAHPPLQRIQGWLGVQGLFDSAIVLDRPPPGSADPQPNGRSLASAAQEPQAPVAVELHATVHPDRVALELLCRAASAPDGVLETTLNHLKVLLEGLAKHPDRNPAALAMRTRSEGRDQFWKALERTGEAS